jgi:tetratricopeptide (TPR) repeat protein
MKSNLIRLCLLFFAVAPALAWSSFVRQDETPPIHDDVASVLIEVLEDASRVTAERLYDTAILVQKQVEPTLEELDRVAEDEERFADDRDAADKICGWMYWRYGKLKEAQDRFQRVNDRTPTDFDARDALARLLDARGKTEEAIDAYRALLEELSSDEQKASMALRIALMELTEGGKDGREALAEHVSGEGVPSEVRNRAAIVIALLGKPKDAIELYEIAESGKAHTLDQIRIAEWALRCSEYETAQEAAWDAVRTAELRRDRRYGITLLIEAYRQKDKLVELAQRFRDAESLTKEEHKALVEVLREAEQYDEAISLMTERTGDELPPEVRRDLLEMYREAGREDEMESVYRQLIQDNPSTAIWREGLSRVYLERGQADEARAIWGDFIEVAPESLLLHGADALQGLGLYDLARTVARAADSSENERVAALLFQFGLEREMGDLDAAVAVLRRLEDRTGPGSAARFDLAECWEQLDDLPEATRILEGVKATRPEGEAGEDLEMRLAWLYSEIGDEEKALTAWKDLWTRVNSVPRRRYVEDRMMTVAARIGGLADIAIDIEEKLTEHAATDLEAGLLVRLYSKVGSSAAATEVIEEQFKNTGGSELKLLEEKARIFMTCLDYAAYEKTVKQLIVVDPEGEAEYLQQLAMSMLERGRPIEARTVLKRLQTLEGLEIATEFEAGVLAIAGMRPEAIAVYRKGLAEHPNRIDAYLLVANLMKDLGQGRQAVGMFQYQMEFAAKDDLFTIAVDGVLNMMVRPAAGTRAQVDWARRKTLERLAERHDRSYLYQLLSDLGEERNDRKAMVTALENAVASAGPRRVSILRELMDLCKGSGDSFMGRGWAGDHEKHLDFGRRLIGVGDVVPPQVYLDLGESFLEADDVLNASRTFNLTRDYPDHASFQRHAARLFEEANEVEPALAIYESLLATRPNDVGLLIKVGELQEADGEDDRARGLYSSAIDLLLSRETLSASRKDETRPDGMPVFFSYSGRNQDDWDRFQPRAMMGELSATSTDAVLERLAELEAQLRSDLAKIAQEALPEGETDHILSHPRIDRRAIVARRLALSFGHLDRAQAIDLALLEAFPADDALLERCVEQRLLRGLLPAALNLVEASGREGDAFRALLSQVQGTPKIEDLARVLQPDESIGMLVPLVAKGDQATVREILRRTDLTSIKDDSAPASVLFSAAMWLEDENLILRTGRRLLKIQLDKNGGNSYMLSSTLDAVVGGIPSGQRESFYQYFVGLILNDIEKYSSLMEMLPRLQRRVSEPLADAEQLLALFERFGERGYLYNVGPVLALLPRELQTSSLRDVMGKSEKNMRTYSLIQVIQQYPGELPESLGDFLVDSIESSMQEDGNDNWDPLSQLQHLGGRQAEVMLKLADMMEKTQPDHPNLARTRVTNLMVLDREKEAMTIIVDAWNKELDEYLKAIEEDPEGPKSKRNFRSKIRKSMKPEHVGALRVALAARMEADGNSERLSKIDLSLADFSRDAAIKADALERALEANPDSKDFLQRALSTYASEGRYMDQVAILERLLANETKKMGIRRRNESLYKLWREIGHSEKALRARQGLGDKAPKAVATEIEVEADTAQLLQPGLMAVTPVSRGSTMIIRSSSFMGTDSSENQNHLVKVKEAIAEEKPSDAKKHFRRYWRQFPKGIESNNPYAFISYGGASPMNWMQWPTDDPKEDEETEKADLQPPPAPGVVPRSRGGLEDWVEPKPVAAEPEVTEEPALVVGSSDGTSEDEADTEDESPPNPYSILSSHDFGLEELERFLRTRTAYEIDGLQRPFYEGLLSGYLSRHGEQETLQDILTRLKEGRAAREHQIMLLTMLDQNPDLVTEDVFGVIHGLERSVDPKDAAQVRRMARVLARAGSKAEALQLYLWCANRGPDDFDSYYFDPFVNQGGVTSQTLLVEAKEFFEGEDRIKLVRAVLSDEKFAEGNQMFYQGNDSVPVQMVIQTWTDMLPPAEALRYARPACESVFDLSLGLRRHDANPASVLFAKAGAGADAVRALEVALCRFEPDQVGQDPDTWYSSPQTDAVRIGDGLIHKLLPLDMSTFLEPGPTLVLIADALESWLAGDRLHEDSAHRLMCILALRLHDHGQTARAQALAQSLASRTGWSGSQKLWIADTARHVGSSELAFRIEFGMLERGRLPVLRMPDLLRHVLEADGPDAALAMGKIAMEITRYAPVMDVLMAAATAQADPDVLAEWTAMNDAAVAVDAEIKSLEFADYEERLAKFEERKAKREARAAEKAAKAAAEAVEAEAAEGEAAPEAEAEPVAVPATGAVGG